MSVLPSPQQFRHLVTLAEPRHFERAARLCAVTKSTLSAGVLALERQVDSEIIDRTAGRHVVFTSLGLELIDRARFALVALEAVTETALITLLPRLALAAGIGEGTDLAIRRLSHAPAERILGLAWRPNSPRSTDFRALASHLTETCRAMLMDGNI